MSLNQLVTPLVPQDIIVENLDVKGDVEVDGSIVITGDLDVENLVVEDEAVINVASIGSSSDGGLEVKSSLIGITSPLIDFVETTTGIYIPGANGLLGKVFKDTFAKDMKFQLPTIAALKSYISSQGLITTNNITHSFTIVNQSAFFVQMTNGGDSDWKFLAPNSPESSLSFYQYPNTSMTYKIIFGDNLTTIVLESAGGTYSQVPLLSNGQIIIGSTDENPIVGSVTGTAPVILTNGAGTIDVSIDPTGDLELNALETVFLTSTGITQLGETQVNSFAIDAFNQTVLTNFKIQSFTPVLSFGGASVGIVYANQVGTIMSINNMNFVCINIGITSKGSSTGAAQISLPAISNNGIDAVGSAYWSGITFPAIEYINVVPYVAVAQQKVDLTLVSNVFSVAPQFLTNTDFQNIAALTINIQYQSLTPF